MRARDFLFVKTVPRLCCTLWCAEMSPTSPQRLAELLRAVPEVNGQSSARCVSGACRPLFTEFIPMYWGLCHELDYAFFMSPRKMPPGFSSRTFLPVYPLGRSDEGGTKKKIYDTVPYFEIRAGLGDRPTAQHYVIAKYSNFDLMSCDFCISALLGSHHESFNTVGGI